MKKITHIRSKTMFTLSIMISCLLTLQAVAVEKLYVKDFGAVGDGKTDDGPGLRKAISAAHNVGEKCIVYLESGKTYYMAPHNKHNGRMMFMYAKDITVDGKGSMLKIHPANKAFGIYRSGKHRK
ncbi:glycosyl hydrolase family 28-related protein [Rubritalea profundi]|nr:glycosyl hydrolase family 28-related protein [Rubritalea profundi]